MDSSVGFFLHLYQYGGYWRKTTLLDISRSLKREFDEEECILNVVRVMVTK
jgi:hypothetical protein